MSKTQVDTSVMNGRDLFTYYTMVYGDHEYENTLFSAHLEIGDALFPMLERCEKEGKRIHLKYDEELQSAGVSDCPFEVIIC